VILRQVQAVPLSESIADAERAPGFRRLIEAQWRQPSVFDIGKRTLQCQDIGRPGGGRHVAIDDRDIRPIALRGDNAWIQHQGCDERQGSDNARMPVEPIRGNHVVTLSDRLSKADDPDTIARGSGVISTLWMIGPMFTSWKGVGLPGSIGVKRGDVMI